MIGTYVLRDEILLATPPPHPSEGPPVNPNPLNTAIAPPTAGVKLSFAVLAPKHSSYQRPSSPLSQVGSSGGGSGPSREGSHHEGSGSNYGSNADSSGFRPNAVDPDLLVFGHANPALQPVVNGKAKGKDKDGDAKRRKPKNNMVKSSSTFISRVIPHEQLKEKLVEHIPEGLFAFANVNRAFMWLDLSSSTKVHFASSVA